MPACSFFKKMFKEPRGLTMFTFDGRAVNYCSSKCRKNSALNRDPRKVKWIKKDKESANVLEGSSNSHSNSNLESVNKKSD